MKGLMTAGTGTPACGVMFPAFGLFMDGAAFPGAGSGWSACGAPPMARGAARRRVAHEG